MEVISAAPFLALLNESDNGMKVYALGALDLIVHLLWAEIANSITQMEDLCESEQFSDRALAALVISKVYYNLGDFGASVKYALVADDRFDVLEQSQYVETIVSHCIDQYIAASLAKFVNPELVIDQRLTKIFERMINKCFAAGSYESAIGIGLESHRLDIVENAIHSCSQIMLGVSASRLIDYCLNCVNVTTISPVFKTKALEKLVQLVFATGDFKSQYTIFKILVHLDNVDFALDTFIELSRHNLPLVAYQGAFILAQAASQEYLDAIIKRIMTLQTQLENSSRICNILSGLPRCDLELTFLHNNNSTDVSILNKTKNLLDAKSSIHHSAVTFANAFMHAGTSDDSFFRKNLEWLGRASNWLKFSATAALGVIHRGNLSQGRNILKPYLPGTSGSPHSKGGSLFALGLIYSGHGRDIIGYLKDYINTNGNSAGSNDIDVSLHGAALGVGVAGMASRDNDHYEALNTVLYTDSAVLGQAAGLAMGLVMLGSADENVATDMLTYAQETLHGNITRGLAMGIALLFYGRAQDAESMIDSLLEKEDSTLRYGGAFTIALAYAGTGNDSAIKKLLHCAVSDPNDDVRRASVVGLGFLLIRNYKAAPQIVKLLAHSHNAHVRYGTCMALGVACAGRGLDEAITVLEPLTKDSVDFVRQGAMIAISMILIETVETQYPKAVQFNELFAECIKNKHEDSLAKFGATLAQGIINAGGRNVSIQLEDPYTRNLNMRAVAGLAVFLQSWFWFPLAHFMCLSFTPTAIIGVTGDMKAPKFQMECHSSPELFQYPAKVENAREKTPDILVRAVLSTTARAKTREMKKQLAEGGVSKMEIDDEIDLGSNRLAESKLGIEVVENSVAKPGALESNAESKTPSARKSIEPQYTKLSFPIENMSRVLPSQACFISFGLDLRFSPVRKSRGFSGVFVLADLREGEKYESIRTLRQLGTTDAPVPEPFVLFGQDLAENEPEIV